MKKFPIDLLRRLKRCLIGQSAAQIPNAGGLVGRQNQPTREAWLENTLKNIPAGLRILDAGAGELQYKRLCAHLEYVSQDFNQYDGAGDSRGLQLGQWDTSKIDIVSDITHIPQPDASFDAIMCVEVLEHVPAPVDALRELARLLKSGGVLILTAPFCSLTHFAPYFYQTGYSRYFYEHWLDRFGFTIEEMQWNGNYFEYLAQELRRLPSISEEYGQVVLGRDDRLAMNRILGTLSTLSARDSGSNQLLSYGLQVLARKKAQ
jgi:ubiquinone/menaquinone biosynthesis C-methylase UbiE